MIEINLSISTAGDNLLTFPEMRAELSKRAHVALDETLEDMFSGCASQGRTHFMARELAIPFHMSKKEMQTILQDLGWQVKANGEWNVTNDGVEDGGAELSEGRIFWSYDSVCDALNREGVFANE